MKNKTRAQLVAHERILRGLFLKLRTSGARVTTKQGIGRTMRFLRIQTSFRTYTTIIDSVIKHVTPEELGKLVNEDWNEYCRKLFEDLASWMGSIKSHSGKKVA